MCLIFVCLVGSGWCCFVDGVRFVPLFLCELSLWGHGVRIGVVFFRFILLNRSGAIVRGAIAGDITLLRMAWLYPVP